MGIKCALSARMDAMLSIERCREILGAGSEISDEEVRQIRDQLYELATIVMNGLQVTGSSNKSVQHPLPETPRVDR